MEILLRLDGSGRLPRRGDLLLCVRNVVQQSSDPLFAAHCEFLLFRHLPDSQCGRAGQLEIVAGHDIPLVLVHIYNLVLDPWLHTHHVHLQFVQHVSGSFKGPLMYRFFRVLILYFHPAVPCLMATSCMSILIYYPPPRSGCFPC